MTLENFFTSTELKDGLTSPTRVNELLTVLQNEKENIVKNVSNATHQWSAVATTLAATENKDCLDLFIQLDGLWFIDKWLKEAQKLMNDGGNGFLDELVIALLRGLERLQVDHHRSVGSGIGLTVQGLLGHSSIVVREKAKDLCDRWALVQDVDGPPRDVISVAISPGGNSTVENVEQLVFSDTVQQETVKEEIPTQDVIMGSETEIIKVENNESKSESTPLMGISSPLEDIKVNQVNHCLTTISDRSEQKTSTSDIGLGHGLQSATKTEPMDDIIDKDEEMVDGGDCQSPDNRNTTTEFDKTSRIGDSASGGRGLKESPDADNPKMKSDTESDEVDEDEKRDGIDNEDDLGSRSRFSKRLMKSRDDDLINKRPSDMELDYGMVDPLELARQVANEVELDVDSQEQSCSTSTDEKEHHSTGGSGKEVSSGPEPGPGPSPKGSPTQAKPDIPTAQINEMGQEPGLNPEKGFSGFDLNQEVSSDEIEIETDHPADQILMTSVSVVSASRATAVDGLPVAPLQFKGTLGWKGSAATSAFRRIPEGEKTHSSSSSLNNSNQHLNHLDFDLNVAEGSDDKIQDFLSRDKVEESSKLQLDLNSFGDVDAGLISLDWKLDGRVASLRQNGPQCQPSSSMQPSYKNNDLSLNGRLTNQYNALFNDPFLGKPFNNKRDDSGISIFGTQVGPNRNDYVLHPPQPTNGRITVPSVDFSLSQPGSGLALGSSMPYPNLPAYGYGHNGYSVGPMYGPPGAPVPYMVDSRGAPIVPPPIPPAFSQPTQPFFFNMAAGGAPSGSNGAGPSHNSLDLNPGFITDMGSRENYNNSNNMGLRQFFNHNQASSSSVVGGKREEPDSGWELFPMNYKHQQPPWQ